MQTFNILFTGDFLDGSGHAVLDDMELDVREGLLRVRTGFPLDRKPDPDDPSYWDLSIPRTQLSQEKDPAAGPDAPGSATCVSSSCHRGVFTCPNQKTAGFGAWLFAERQGFVLMDGNSESSERNASSSGSPLVTVMKTSDFWDLDHGSEFRRLNRSRFRRVLTQCQMCACLQIVVEIGLERPS